MENFIYFMSIVAVFVVVLIPFTGMRRRRSSYTSGRSSTSADGGSWFDFPSSSGDGGSGDGGGGDGGGGGD